MAQVLIITSLALSILTFAISLIEILPEREDYKNDNAKREALKYNTLVCLVLPFVLAYCLQTDIISTLCQQWISRRQCLPCNATTSNYSIAAKSTTVHLLADSFRARLWGLLNCAAKTVAGSGDGSSMNFLQSIGG